MDEAIFRKFRSRFPIFRSTIYLNSCSQGALSDCVEESLREYMESWRARGSPWDHWVEAAEDLRAEFASMIGASPEEIALSFAASTALYAVASSLEYRARPEVAVGELEFPTLCHIWLAQERRGARIVWVRAAGPAPLPEDYSLKLSERTLLVPVTHVGFRDGCRLDPRGIARVAHGAGAMFLLDDYQSCGTRPIDVRSVDADFYVAGSLKYLLGAPGVAFLFVKRELIERFHPTLTGWFAQKNPFAFDIRRNDPADSAARFQTGTPAIPSVYAARAGLRLLRELGLDQVRERIAQLSRQFIRGAIDRGLRLKTPENSEGPLVVVEGRDTQSAAETVRRLERLGIIVSSRDSGIRVSFHAYNAPEDVDAVLEALAT
jgi:selenocysteine lyase/cysteine desulfurase